MSSCTHSLIIMEIVKCQKCGMVWMPGTESDPNGHRHIQLPSDEPSKPNKVDGIKPGEDITGEIPEWGVHLATIPSTDKLKAAEGLTYEIYRNDSGHLYCTCPAFLWSGKVCKHVRVYQENHPEYSFG